MNQPPRPVRRGVSLARLTALLGGSLLVTSAWSPPHSRDEKPLDVLVVVLDDIAASDVATVETPMLDHLAARGVRFSRGVSHPLCSPSRRSLFFGEWRGVHAQAGCEDPTERTPGHEELSIAKTAKGRGYETGLFGKWHLGSNRLGDLALTPHLHGFDTWRAGLWGNLSNCGGSNYWNWVRVEDGEVAPSTEYHTTAVVEGFVDWWTENAGRKRMAMVAFQAAHSPFHVPPGYPDAFDWSQRERFEFMIEHLDQSLQWMLSVVDLDTTAVVLVADNGTPPGGRTAQQDPSKVKGTTFRDGIEVPMLLLVPGGTAWECREWVHLVDVYATVAELVGADLDVVDRKDSFSLLGAAQRPGWTPARPFVFCENDTPNRPYEKAVIAGGFKVRETLTALELYDLTADAAEEQPLPFDALDPAVRGVFAEALKDPSRVGARFRASETGSHE